MADPSKTAPAVVLDHVTVSYGTNRALRDVSVVFPTGAVGLLGPARMDYDKAIRSVRGAAQELSRFVEEVYEDN